MTLDDAAYRRKSDPASFEFVRGVQSLKRPEKFLRVVHVEADAIVSHEIDILACARLTAHLNCRGRLISGEFDRIGKEVVKNLRYKTLVAVRGRQFSEVERDVSFFARCGLLLLECGLGQFSHSDFRENHLFPAKSR